MRPALAYHASFLAALAEYHAEGRHLELDAVALADEEEFARYVAALNADVERPGESARFIARLTGTEPEAYPDGYVPQTTLWWVAGAEYLGRLAIRHRLTPHLLDEGGNMGYEVRPSARGRGHATAMLAAALPLAAALGIDPARVDCDTDNPASRRVIEKNGGRLEREENDTLFFLVPTAMSGVAGEAAREGAPARGAAHAREAPRHVYVHVPFCRAKCDYCDFASVAVGDKPSAALLDDFVAAVAAEWELERAAHARAPPAHAVRGRRHAELAGAGAARAAARAVPALPHAARRGHRRGEPRGRDAGVRGVGGGGAAALEAAAGEEAPPRRLRVSLGVQSFDAALRAALGRRASADPAAAFARLRAAGVSDLSVDLIFGIPGQTPAMLDADLAAVARLRPAHVSWYELDVVPGTPLAARLARRREPRPDDDARAGLYRRVVAGLARLGYRWYEVSNFALPGHRSRHNLAYWRGRDYLGLGPGAVSTVGARRWRDRADVSAYCAALAAGRDARALAAGREPPRTHERLDAAAQQRERLLLAARIGAPVPLATLAGALDAAALPPLAAAGFISLHGGTLTVTRKGRYVANEVCVRLFRA